MKKLLIFGDSIIKGVTYNGQSYHLCQQHDFDALAAQGVTVNCVAPGSVSPSEHSDVTYTEPSQLSFMGRTGSDAENAALICFLASDEASYISAQNIQIDGCRRKQ